LRAPDQVFQRGGGEKLGFRGGPSSRGILRKKRGKRNKIGDVLEKSKKRQGGKKKVEKYPPESKKGGGKGSEGAKLFDPALG